MMLGLRLIKLSNASINLMDSGRDCNYITLPKLQLIYLGKNIALTTNKIDNSNVCFENGTRSETTFAPVGEVQETRAKT